MVEGRGGWRVRGRPAAVTADWGSLWWVGAGWVILDTAWGKSPTSPRFFIPPFAESPPLSRKHPYRLLPRISPFPARVPRSSACLLRVWETPSPPSCFLQLEGREPLSVTVSHVPLASEDARLRGPAHLPRTLSSLPSVSFFFSSPTEPPSSPL